ncbi:hypothetical protein GUJ93_ZPchr0004g39647 [Zizania palustris]|uniref:Uncharacterized protein n=1 Tax=Zizania palustris TaxID=103762 RepID=A0A8J5S6P4_ZIZPA|nr:hypothetical protein GUJ93_ZPchr0004g39647 [Zizania palustris]
MREVCFVRPSANTYLPRGYRKDLMTHWHDYYPRCGGAGDSGPRHNRREQRRLRAATEALDGVAARNLSTVRQAEDRDEGQRPPEPHDLAPDVPHCRSPVLMP